MKKVILVVTIFTFFLASFCMVSCGYIYVTATNAELARISAGCFFEASLVIITILTSLKFSCFSKN